jgi:hypothetical protein
MIELVDNGIKTIFHMFKKLKTEHLKDKRHTKKIQIEILELKMMILKCILDWDKQQIRFAQEKIKNLLEIEKETIQNKTERERIKSQWSISELWDNFKLLIIIGVPQGEERRSRKST